MKGELTVHNPDLVARVALEEIPVAYPTIQPLGDDRLLIVGAAE